MNACMHTYICIHTYTYIHTYTHTYEHTYIHTYIHTYTYVHALVVAPMIRIPVAYSPKDFCCPGILCFLRRWFKGNDSRILVRWLDYTYTRVLADFEDDHENYVVAIQRGLKAINKFISGLFRQSLWIEPGDAWVLATHGMKFMDAYNMVANYALKTLQLPRFKVPPKLHMFAHLVHDLYAAHRTIRACMNVVASSCQMDEDYVGRVAFQSRQVSIRSVHERKIQRYLVNLCLRW